MLRYLICLQVFQMANMGLFTSFALAATELPCEALVASSDGKIPVPIEVVPEEFSLVGLPLFLSRPTAAHEVGFSEQMLGRHVQIQVMRSDGQSAYIRGTVLKDLRNFSSIVLQEEITDREVKIPAHHPQISGRRVEFLDLLPLADRWSREEVLQIEKETEERLEQSDDDVKFLEKIQRKKAALFRLVRLMSRPMPTAFIRRSQLLSDVNHYLGAGQSDKVVGMLSKYFSAVEKAVLVVRRLDEEMRTINALKKTGMAESGALRNVKYWRLNKRRSAQLEIIGRYRSEYFMFRKFFERVLAGEKNSQGKSYSEVYRAAVQSTYSRLGIMSDVDVSNLKSWDRLERPPIEEVRNLGISREARLAKLNRELWLERRMAARYTADVVALLPIVRKTYSYVARVNPLWRENAMPFIKSMRDSEARELDIPRLQLLISKGQLTPRAKLDFLRAFMVEDGDEGILVTLFRLRDPEYVALREELLMTAKLEQGEDHTALIERMRRHYDEAEVGEVFELVKPQLANTDPGIYDSLLAARERALELASPLSVHARESIILRSVKAAMFMGTSGYFLYQSLPETFWTELEASGIWKALATLPPEVLELLGRVNL